MRRGDTGTLRHPSGGDTIWTIRTIHRDGRCDIENSYGAQLRCKLADLQPHDRTTQP